MKLKSKILLLFVISIFLITSGVSVLSIEKLYNKNLINLIDENSVRTREHLGSLEKYLSKGDGIEIDDIYGYIEDFSLDNTKLYEIFLDERMIFKNHSLDIPYQREELSLDKSNYILRNLDNRLYLMVSGIFKSGNNKLRLVNVVDIQWVEDQRRQEYFYVFSMLVFVLFFGSIIVKKILDILFVDMDRLRVMTEKIGQGNYGYAIENYRNDEIGDLIESFNNMGSLVNNQVDEIKKDKELKDKFLRNFNHEIKTPLTSIIGISDMLVNGLVKDVDKAEMTEIINLEGKRILSLQRVVLKELELDKIKIEKISLKSVFKEVSYIYKYSSDKKSVRLLYEGDDYDININPKLFIQGIGNIIDNCIRYSSDGDFILFRADRSYIEIHDNGPGIDEKIKTDIFQVFEKSEESKGQGIGLYLSKRIIDKHGFSISVKSSEKGSVFRIDYK